MTTGPKQTPDEDEKAKTFNKFGDADLDWLSFDDEDEVEGEDDER